MAADLGLLRELAQSGVPPEVLFRVLLATQPGLLDVISTLPPAAAPAGGEATLDPPDLDTGGVFGAGNMSPSQTLSAALSGARQGAIGQGVQALGGPKLAGSLAAKGITMGSQMLGVPGMVPSLLNALFGAAMKVGQGALQSKGQQIGPMRFGGPAVVPMIDPTFPSNARFADPEEPHAPDVPDVPTIPEGLVTMGALAPDPNDPSSVAAFADPTASLADAISAAIAEAGGNNAGIGDTGLSGSDTSDGSGVGAY